MNTIDNDVQAYITNAGSATASAGDNRSEHHRELHHYRHLDGGLHRRRRQCRHHRAGPQRRRRRGDQRHPRRGPGLRDQHQPRQLRDDRLEHDGHLDHHGDDTRHRRLAQLRHFDRRCRLDRRRGGDQPDRLRHAAATATPVAINAYVLNSSVKAGGAYTIKATADETIKATTAAGSVAVAATSGGTSVAVSGSGVFVENKIADTVLAYHDGGTTTAGINAPSVSISAGDTSTITATAAAASLAASFGKTGVSISIGLSLATNQIDNDVEAYIANAVTPVAPATTGVTTTVGGISVMSTESATINGDLGGGVAGRGRRPGDGRGDQRGGRRGDQRHPGQGQRLRLGQ